MTCLGNAWPLIAARTAHLPPPDASGQEIPSSEETRNDPDPGMEPREGGAFRGPEKEEKGPCA